jgi:hypothetical protein
MYRIVEYEQGWENYLIFEKKHIDRKCTDYIEISINTINVNTINHFEECGYRFSEFRIERSLFLNDLAINESSYYPYTLDIVADLDTLKKILKIASSIHFDDRFSIGGNVSKGYSTKRNISFLKNAFIKKGEFILYFFNRQNQKILGYQTGKFVNNNEVLLFLSGRSEMYDLNNYHEMFDLLFFKWLSKSKIKFVKAVSSSVNLNELNIAFQSQRFKIDNTSVTLQKWFSKQI